MEETKSTQPYWNISEEKGLLHLLDVDKNLYAYVKWDGTIHLWYYEDEVSFDHDTGVKDYSDMGFEGKSHHSYYDMFDIDDRIAQLQALRAIAIDWFAKRGEHWPPK